MSGEPTGSAPPPSRTACCGRGQPEPSAGHEILSRDVHEGWSELRVRCQHCGRSWRVVEDVGYHVPQYDWQ